MPPKTQRKAILSKACEGLLDDEAMARLAQVEKVPPAVIARAAGGDALHHGRRPLP